MITGPSKEVIAKEMSTGIITFCVIFSAPLRFYDVFAHRIFSLECSSFSIIEPFFALCKGVFPVKLLILPRTAAIGSLRTGSSGLLFNPKVGQDIGKYLFYHRGCNSPPIINALGIVNNS